MTQTCGFPPPASPAGGGLFDVYKIYGTQNQFDFSGHTGSWAARPLECPISREVCACGMMSFKKEWLVFNKIGKKYEVCVHFIALGPDVPKEGTSDSFPVMVICGRD